MKIAAQAFWEKGVVDLGEKSPVGAKGIVPGIPCAEHSQAGRCAPITACNLLLVKYAIFLVPNIMCALIFIVQPGIKFPVHAVKKLRVNKKLFQAIGFFGTGGSFIAFAPELIRVIAIGTLEPENLVFVWKVN